MKKVTLLLALTLMTASVAQAVEPVCDVTVCNRIHRFSLSIWSHIKDSMGEQCFQIRLPKSEAVPGKVLDSQSRWYQGSSMNFTKKSVTTVKSVGMCK